MEKVNNRIKFFHKSSGNRRKIVRTIWLTIIATVMSVFFLAGCEKKEETEAMVSQTDEINVSACDEMPSAVEEDKISEEIHADSNEEKLAVEENSLLDEEILAIEEASLEIQSQLQAALTQEDMNVLSGQDYQLWDDELNSLWSRFCDNASDDFKTTVLDEQRTWIEDKEDKVELAGAEYEEGSIRSLIKNKTASDITRIRCYELAGYLAEVTGQKFGLEVPRPKVLEFADRYGTDTIYSKLTMEDAEGNNYTATIGIYRLTTFEGKAVMQNDDVYEFEDEIFGVKGIIRILDDCSRATFEITESEWNLVNAGDVFEFPERR